MAGASTMLIALAAFFWGVSGGIAGILLDSGWDASVVSFYRGFVGLLFALVWLLFQRRYSGLNSRQLWFWSVVAGLGVAGNFTFYFLSIEYGNVAVAATLMYCAPVFVYLVSFALKLERPTAAKWLAIGLVMVGIVLLTKLYAIGASGLSLIGVGTGLLAGLSYAAFIFGFKYAAPHGSPQAILSVAFTVLAIALLLPTDINQAVSVISAPELPLFLALGILGAGLSFLLYVVGIKHAAPALASMIAMVEPVTATLFGVVVLNESLGVIQMLGMGIILVTVTALSVTSR
ncbi:DMT family transporter [Halomonas sp. ISL-60]|uniref:DMT family transporter n=1 Tax=Halomonas sp. ISL-56 TaxID=2819149 RepID=UPI001BE81882|nr:DMT family transporter [Halomonas sp. ISL-56]MBT2771366.1 DMT family transporter [Halomonas sp. ISL-60]MBT2801569.1 DMT family transporter [Halomonas sp. ISL-56]